jgi:hypothetical protein
VSPKRELTSENVRAYLGRPWGTLAQLKEAHWEQAYRTDPLSAFRASMDLWELLHQAGRIEDPAEREADLEAHLALRALLDRTAHVRPR